MSETHEPLPIWGDFDRLLERTFPDRIGGIRRSTRSGESAQDDWAYWSLLAFIQWEKDSRKRTPGVPDRLNSLLRYGSAPSTDRLLTELLHERATLHALTGLSPDQGDARIRLIDLLDAAERRIRRELAPRVTRSPIEILADAADAFDKARTEGESECQREGNFDVEASAVSSVVAPLVDTRVASPVETPSERKIRIYRRKLDIGAMHSKKWARMIASEEPPGPNGEPLTPDRIRQLARQGEALLRKASRWPSAPPAS